MYRLVMDPVKWGYGNANLHNVYFDEINRSQLLSIRKADLDLVFDLIFKNRNDEARNVLEHDDKMIRQQNLPYGMTSRNNDHDKISLGFLEACYRVGDKSLAAKVFASVKRDLEQQQAYYASLDEHKKETLQYESSTVQSLLGALREIEKSFAPGKPVQRQ
jgi:hypothetical protein